MERNIRLYPWYQAFHQAYFWLPVFFLYFNQHVSLTQVLQLEAIYFACVVLLEVPSGYFSDVMGRRKTLVMGAVSLVAAYLLFAGGSSFLSFAFAQVLLAVGLAFNSGTDVSLHYESLAACGQKEAFGDREAIASRFAFQSNALAALLGGALGLFSLRGVYVLSALAACGVLGIALAFKEPHSPERQKTPAAGLVRQVSACFGLLKDKALLWLFLFAVLMTVLNHVPYEFYQPYLRLLSDEGLFRTAQTPLITGVHTALTLMIASWFASRSVAFSRRVKLGIALLTAMVLQLTLIGLMGAILHSVVAGLLLLRSVPRGLMTAPLNAAIAPRVGSEKRATYLSFQSLAGRLAFASTLFALSLTGTGGEETDHASLQIMVWVAGGVGLIGLGFLIVTLGRVAPAEGLKLKKEPQPL